MVTSGSHDPPIRAEISVHRFNAIKPITYFLRSELLQRFVLPLRIYVHQYNNRLPHLAAVFQRAVVERFEQIDEPSESPTALIPLHQKSHNHCGEVLGLMRHRFGLDCRDKLGRKVRGQTLNDVE